MKWEIKQGHVLSVLKTLPDESVQCCVTSPPYWGLRSYKTEPQVWGGEVHEHEWQSYLVPAKSGGVGKSTLDEESYGNAMSPEAKERSQRRQQTSAGEASFCPCGAWRGELGLEPTPELFVQHIVEVFREVRRVLRSDGSCWINLGDSYCGSWGNAGNRPQLDGKAAIQRERDSKYFHRKGYDEHREVPPTNKIAGLKPKDLVGIPWRVAFALQADSWYLRSDIIWSKPNPMPESVTDRPTKSHEYVFLLTKSPRYFFDQDAVRAPVSQSTTKTRNIRSVWHIPTFSFPEAHFATFPEDLVEPCLRAGTSEKGSCAKCGAPWERVTKPTEAYQAQLDVAKRRSDKLETYGLTRGNSNPSTTAERVTIGWHPTCSCQADTQPCLVLDPFCGSGTVGVVALKLGQDFLGIELQPDYVAMAKRRIGAIMPLFAGESVSERLP